MALLLPQALTVIFVGDAVVAVTEFHNSEDKSSPNVEKNMRGIVQRVDKDGDYLVKWEPMSDTKATFCCYALRSQKQIHRLSGEEVQFMRVE